MKIELGFLETRVARRLFTRFVISALLPIGVLAGLSYATVSENLRVRSDQRMTEVALATERAVRDRLDRADSDLRLLTQFYERARTNTTGNDFTELLADLPRPSGFTEVRFDLPEGRRRADDAFPELDGRHTLHLRAGKSALVEAAGDGEATLYLARAIGSDPDNGVLWARLDRSYLWETSAELASLPDIGGMCVLNSAFSALHGPTMASASFGSAVRTAVQDREPGQFEWEDEAGNMRSVHRSIFLGPDFASSDWHVVVSVPEAAVTAPLAAFSRTFLPLVLTAFLVVLLLSDSQIRRTIRPLLRLHEATQRVGAENFEASVDIASGDEFQDLAQSFNQMADRLGVQFRTLTVMSQIDRAGLSAPHAGPVIDATLQALLDLGQAEVVALCVPDRANPGQARSHAIVRSAPNLTVEHSLQISSQAFEGLRAVEHHAFQADEGTSLPAFLTVRPLNDLRYRHFLVLPLDPDRPEAGVLSLACSESEVREAAFIRRVRRVADQAALAFSNVHRQDELSELNLGTLKALARAIDASSAWTAGHSERVTRIATAIGRRMGLDQEQLDLLERGSLLHDIGKIGVPMDVLNKSGALTDDEFARIKAHVTMGPRILEPIQAYAPMMNIVRHHHERVDGRGYPDGLTGDQIDLKARIVAVADTFDALTSDRPYRKGLPLRTAVEVVRNAAGSQLDPDAVEVFLVMVEEGCDELFPDDEEEPNYDDPAFDDEFDDEGELIEIGSRVPARAG